VADVNAHAIVLYRENTLVSITTTGDELDAQRLYLEAHDLLRTWPVRGMVYTIEGQLDPNEVRTSANAPRVGNRYTHLPMKGST